MTETTGRLEKWCVDKVYPSIIWGNLYDDRHKRWRQGQRIHTSSIITPPEEWKEGAVITTMNSTYLLGEKLHQYDK